MFKRLVTLAALTGAALMFSAACGGGDEAPAAPAPERASPPIPPPGTTASASSASAAASGPVAGGTEVFVGLDDAGGRGPFVFTPPDLEFSVGEAVNFSFESESQFHTFTISELGIDVGVDGGDIADFSFTFDSPGTYPIICIPHEALGMVGTLTVQ